MLKDMARKNKYYPQMMQINADKLVKMGKAIWSNLGHPQIVILWLSQITLD